MLKCGNWCVGVCSWSLQRDVAGVAEAMEKLGIEHVHLAVAPAAGEQGREYLDAIMNQKWIVSSAMVAFAQEDYSSLESIKKTGGIAPDECWEVNRDMFLECVDITADLGCKYISTHVGFIDHTRKEYAEKFYDRVRVLADAAQEKGLEFLMETGQETAVEMRQFMDRLNHPAVGVNFDPANMILYDKGDPIEAVHVLASWIKHVHIKDAIRTRKRGRWGLEVPWGEGEVRNEEFLRILRKIGFKGVLAIEREAGEDRFGDIEHAAQIMKRFGKM